MEYFENCLKERFFAKGVFQGHAEFFSDFVDDFLEMTHSYDATYDAKIPRFIMGHSLGGLICLAVAIESLKRT